MRKLAIRLAICLALAVGFIFLARLLYLSIFGSAPPYWFVEFAKMSGLLIVFIGIMEPFNDFLDQRKQRKLSRSPSSAEPAESESKVAGFPPSRE